MKITSVECSILAVPDCNPDACDSSQDTIVVEVHTDEGIVGVGEVDANPWVIKAHIEAPGSHIMSLGLADLLIGQDPTQPRSIWDRLYTFSAMTGRRGAGICAIGALDIAIWDIYGKAQGRPIWSLLGGACRNSITPYASLIPEGRTLESQREDLLRRVTWAQEFGFTAAKLEVCVKGPYAHNCLQEGNEAIVEMVAACRERVGPKMTLMVDVAYCWNDWKEALSVIRQLEAYNIFFIETPLPSDDLGGYARLAEATSVRIAAGEWLQTRYEFADLMERGRVDVIQPDIGRVGGITEAMRVVQMALDRGTMVVPHCWKTGISVAATAHVAAASPNCPFIENLPAEVAHSRLRRELVNEELTIKDGRMDLPRRPGLGIELRSEAKNKFATSGKKIFQPAQTVQS
ncbi:MAG TPA: mandelate racemase/muconate lactonizing enzyme family protein [Candidatus Angelobacter sp.]|nr:mandelate racemase/muconate lactonizing enzyme family protein [Candidatus Angelobacter sp.]